MSSIPSLVGHQFLDRRNFFSHSATALGSIALASLMHKDGLLASDAESDTWSPRIDPARPYAARPAHFPAKAKNVIVIFCAGAVSQLETWDYKPELIKWDDKPLPGGPEVTFQGPAGIWLAAVCISAARSNWQVGQRYDSAPGRTDR